MHGVRFTINCSNCAILQSRCGQGKWAWSAKNFGGVLLPMLLLPWAYIDPGNLKVVDVLEDKLFNYQPHCS